ncbi:hypothetical protein BDA96_01G393300 [Sorghum bicolor]|uniref:Uncharacterized protein n=2 Tax=Sorghum bicolor TaxID=4558 RepID=A0A921V0B0_SORBI|nr:hypothetical protein BDA96_01G393300 [Sorghum bicolor]OQU92581.1 hypothetical protein SORBI_3001G369401 [Sorghum bicolor]
MAMSMSSAASISRAVLPWRTGRQPGRPRLPSGRIVLCFEWSTMGHVRHTTTTELLRLRGTSARSTSPGPRSCTCQGATIRDANECNTGHAFFCFFFGIWT